MKNEPATTTAPAALRRALALALLAIGAICGFGFLCTFEPSAWWITWSWRIGCAILGLGALGGVLTLAGRRSRKSP